LKGAALYIISLCEPSPDETAKIKDCLGNPLNIRTIQLQPGFRVTNHHFFNRRPLHVVMRWESRSFDSDFFHVNELRGQREWTLIVIFDRSWTGTFSVKPQVNTQLFVNTLEITWPAEDAILRIEKNLQMLAAPPIALHIGTSTLMQRTNPAI